MQRLAAGEPVPSAEGAQRLARRLLDAGLAHPRPPALAGPRDVAVVIPVHDDPGGLAATLSALVPAERGVGDGGKPLPAEPIVVVDDASAESVGLAAGGAPGDAAVIRRAAQGGPAAARNAGWRAVTANLVAFVDANCEPEPGWLDHLLPHFGDPLVAAVAPRIVAASHRGAPGWLAAYESVRSPLDLGPREANVRPRSPVAYVPTAALVVRRTALEALGGFDETLTVGEDVDFVWRLVAAGWTVRYEPGATVRHPMRPTTIAWLEQRYRYGTSAAPLARRHGAAVAPAVVSPWTAAAWALVAAGQPLGGLATAGYSVAALAGGRSTPRLAQWVGAEAGTPAVRPVGAETAGGRRIRPEAGQRPIRLPLGETVRLAGVGHVRGGLSLARAVRRAWPPMAVLLAATSRRSRPALVAAAVVPGLVDWAQRRPRLDPLRFCALHLAYDLAYAAGLWAGCRRERSVRALLPEFSGARRHRPRQTDGSASPTIGGRA